VKSIKIKLLLILIISTLVVSCNEEDETLVSEPDSKEKANPLDDEGDSDPIVDEEQEPEVSYFGEKCISDYGPMYGTFILYSNANDPNYESKCTDELGGDYFLIGSEDYSEQNGYFTKIGLNTFTYFCQYEESGECEQTYGEQQTMAYLDSWVGLSPELCLEGGELVSRCFEDNNNILNSEGVRIKHESEGAGAVGFCETSEGIYGYKNVNSYLGVSDEDFVADLENVCSLNFDGWQNLEEYSCATGECVNPNVGQCYCKANSGDICSEGFSPGSCNDF